MVCPIPVRQASYAKKFNGKFFVGVEGSFGANHVTPRGLSARLLGQMVCIEGIVSKCTLIHPKVVKSVHYCEATEQSLERSYRDITSLDGMSYEVLILDNISRISQRTATRPRDLLY